MDLEGYAWFCVFLGKIDGLLHYLFADAKEKRPATSTASNKKVEFIWTSSWVQVWFITLPWLGAMFASLSVSLFNIFFWGLLGRSKMDPQNTKPQRFADPYLWTQEFLLIFCAGFCWRKKHFRGAHGTEVETGNVTFFKQRQRVGRT